jgi:hypothetical protein
MTSIESPPSDQDNAHPLTLVMSIRDEQAYLELKGLLEKLQSGPVGSNPIRTALDELVSVHFARFAFIGTDKLAVITTYDGEFEVYIGTFVNHIGHVFDMLLQHMKDAPPLPVKDNSKAFLEYVKANDLKCIEPFYSAYPGLSVRKILELQADELERDSD